MYAYPSHVTQGFLEVMAERPADLQLLRHAAPAHPSRRRCAGCAARTARSTSCWPGFASVVPDVTVRTTFITGFPARPRPSTATCSDSIETLGFGRVGVFLYSDEEGTASFDHPNRVAPSVKQRRRHELMAAAQAASHRANEALVGTVQEVLIEGEGELTVGRSGSGGAARDAPEVDGVVFVARARLRSARSCQRGSRRALDYDLVGRRRSALQWRHRQHGIGRSWTPPKSRTCVL